MGTAEKRTCREGRANSGWLTGGLGSAVRPGGVPGPGRVWVVIFLALAGYVVFFPGVPPIFRPPHD